MLTDTNEAMTHRHLTIPADGKVVFERVQNCTRMLTFWSEGRLLEFQSTRGQLGEGSNFVIDLFTIRQKHAIPLLHLRWVRFLFLGKDKMKTEVTAQVQIDELKRRTIFY